MAKTIDLVQLPQSKPYDIYVQPAGSTSNQHLLEVHAYLSITASKLADKGGSTSVPTSPTLFSGAYFQGGMAHPDASDSNRIDLTLDIDPNSNQIVQCNQSRSLHGCYTVSYSNPDCSYTMSTMTPPDGHPVLIQCASTDVALSGISSPCPGATVIYRNLYPVYIPTLVTSAKWSQPFAQGSEPKPLPAGATNPFQAPNGFFFEYGQNSWDARPPGTASIVCCQQY
jgi:hypothetical protein